MLSFLGEASLAFLALGIGALHMLAPDHWVPLTIYCHSRKYSVGRSAVLAAAGGFAHVAGSIVAMVAAIAVGLALAKSFENATSLIIGISFVGIGVWMAYSGARAPLTEDEAKLPAFKNTKWLVFATASSPELTIFPIYLAAGVYGFYGEAFAILAFTAGTVIAIVGVTLAGVKGLGRFLRAPGRERQIDYLIGAALILLGVSVIAGL